jgi:protein O-GlcNAc transferase
LAPRPPTSDLAARFREAVRLHQAGRLDQALALYGQILKADPRHADTLHLSGLALLQSGDAAGAVRPLERAVKARDDRAPYHLNLAEAYRLTGKAARAARHYERALALDPGNAGALNNLGGLALQTGRIDAAAEAYRRLAEARADLPDGPFGLGNALYAGGRTEDAIEAYRDALARQADHPGATLNLAQLLAENGRADEAIGLLDTALARHPDVPELHYARGAALRAAGDLAAAAAAYRAALDLRPDFLEARFNLGAALQEDGALDEAAACYERVLEIDPNHARAHNNLGTVHAERADHEAAQACYARARALDPGDPEPLVNFGNSYTEQGRTEDAADAYRAVLNLSESGGTRFRLATLLPVIPGTVEEIADARARYAEALEELAADPPPLADPLGEVGKTAFLLAYHGENDRTLQLRLAETYARACPSLLEAAPHCAGWHGPADKRIRIGFVSRHLRAHTIGRLMAETIRRLDRTRFHVTVFRFPQEDDALAKVIAESADAVATLPPDLAAMRRIIAEARLDVLHYPDIGMEPATYFLGFARLAPVQCAFWGHPDTTGLPGIDYFLSSAAFEAEDAEAHYSETLVRLPTTNVCYARPERPAEIPARAALGLPEDGTLYLCPQSLFKLRPEFDLVLGRILDGDPNATLGLLAGNNAHWTGLLRGRLARNLGDALARVRFIGRLPYEGFLGLLTAADVMLDTPVFCGGNTTLEGLAMGTPIVTLPSPYLRGRLSAGFYAKMGYEDLVARDEDDYVRIALALGTDPNARATARARIEDASPVLFGDERPVRELEDFLVQAVEAASSISRR